MEAIRGRNYEVIAYLDRQGDRTYVREPRTQRPLGYVRADGTYLPDGRRVSYQPVPGLLIPQR